HSEVGTSPAAYCHWRVSKPAMFTLTHSRSGGHLQRGVLSRRPPPCTGREHRDLRGHPQAQGEAKLAQPWIHIQESAGPRVCRSLLGGWRSGGREGRGNGARHKRRDETGWTPAAVPECEADLTAMRVAREAELDAQRRSPGERIRIVRE